ncbi:hypothetical protein [Clostridium hydrogeniformans]|uniref:hypothetical protein n=1 Tax=Clostridium hydrogeniformans TaxID=349933 RepID=UPI0005594D96|nr:hypothetical protein [Clostridium hydrogeniformans]
MNFKKIIATFSLLALMFSTPIIPTSVSHAAPSCPRCGDIVMPGTRHTTCDCQGHNYRSKSTGSKFISLRSHTVSGKRCNYEEWKDYYQDTCTTCGNPGSGYSSTREEGHSCGR